MRLQDGAWKTLLEPLFSSVSFSRYIAWAMRSSTFCVSSYFLWTQKGLTTLPLVRGSAFCVDFTQLDGFYRHHIITAAHVSCPPRYRHLYTCDEDSALKLIGERHVTNKVLLPTQSHELLFRQHFMPHVDVSSLRLKDESVLTATGISPLEVDPTPLEEGESIIIRGIDCKEAAGNPHDDDLTLKPEEFHGVCKAALVSIDYGTVFLGALRDGLDAPLPISMCGGPVVRASNGKVVGVFVARVVRSLPPNDVKKPPKVFDPFLNLADHDILNQWPLHFAFVPVTEFAAALLRSET